jgi:hypothetical protein
MGVHASPAELPELKDFLGLFRGGSGVWREWKPWKWPSGYTTKPCYGG